MHLVDRPRFKLQPPKQGWLPVRVDLDEFVLECGASSVLGDPIGGLLDMLAYSLTPKAGGCRTCLWLEPEGYAIDLALLPEPSRLALRVLFGDFVLPKMRDTDDLQLRFECHVDTREFSSALLVALGELLESGNADALDHWRRDQSHGAYVRRFDALRRQFAQTHSA